MVKKIISVLLILIGIFFTLLPHSVHLAAGLTLPHVYHVTIGLVAGAIGVYLMLHKRKK